MNVTAVDWTIVLVLLAALLAMAIWINTRCRSVADYLVSGRKVRLWLGMGAGIAGEIGLVSIVAMLEQGYMRGFGFVLIGLITMAITLPLFGVFGFGIERFRATRAMSVPQYLEMRYSRGLRILTGITNSAAGVIQMCIFPIVGARFLCVLVQAPPEVSVAGFSIASTSIVMLVLLVCAVTFTFLGGYITLIVTNFFQMIVIMIAIYWLLGHLVADLGMQQLWTTLEQTRGEAAFNPFAEGANAYGVTWFAWLLTMTVLLQFSYGPYLQRYASMDKPKTVSRSYFLGGIFGSGRTFVIIGIGVCALAALGETPPAGVAATGQEWASMASPYYLAQVVPPVLMGLLLAALLFADISTTDQYMLSWSTSIVNDCIYPFLKGTLSPEAHIRLVRMTIVAMCVLFFTVGLFYTPQLPIWEFLWLCANIIGGTGIAVLFGMYWKRTTTLAAYTAVGICVVLPLSDLVARSVYASSDAEGPFPISPEMTGFYTYVIATVALITLSLMSTKPTGYWDLGSQLRAMNAEGARA